MTDVVHVYKDFPPVFGGIENHVATLARALAERHLEVDVLCSRRAGLAGREQVDGIRIERCWSPFALASTPLPPALPWRLRANPAGIVHLHYPWPPGEVAWLVGGRARPLVVTVHCEVVRYPRLGRLLAPLTARVLAAAGRVIVTSQALASAPMLRDHLARVRVVPPGIDLRTFHPGESDDPLPDVPRPRVAFVGRLRHYKGLPVLAKALARVPQAQLVVVGDGPERASFETALGAAGCRDRVRFTGEVPTERLVRILQHADAAVLPSTSRAEAFGVAIVEAQACGVPAVVTDVGTGTTRTLIDGHSGRVVPPNDAAALAAGIEWCVGAHGSAARRAAARQHAVANFSAEKMAAAVQSIYGELRSSPNQP
jgi:rhamnosyl/mannosyltransferase